MKWIKVEDQLPERWENIWLYTEKDGVFLGFYHATNWFNVYGAMVFFVTHWCELIIPEKPE